MPLVPSDGLAHLSQILGLRWHLPAPAIGAASGLGLERPDAYAIEVG